ncbi:Wzz/FepE/Etk N-terminal domain-containing protein [Secundilactobacillus similis]|uniref:Wzz/FepE/Etk N-terminal domain-containing protein n=1 Tax=Secundilactobacillus similis TaxID=414682 RepID=UPI000AF0CB03|nr:Wzz/FepE/Etk N-terminal domain-containing protein [Secundilactobacillus similis]
MDSTLDLRQMFGILRKHIWFIIISTIGFAIIAFGISEFAMTPKYTATTQILVNQKRVLITDSLIKISKLMFR